MTQSNRQFSRRQFLQMAGTSALLLAACQPTMPEQASSGAEAASADAPSTEGSTPIRFAAHGDWGWLTVWLALIDEFNAEYGDQVTVSFEHSTGDIWAKYLTQMAAGTAADVIRWEAKRAPEWMSRGEQLLDLTAFQEADDTVQSEDYFEVLWNDCYYDGKLVQLPHDASPVTLWYNPTIFEERGVEPPPKTWDDPSWTWNRYLEACQELTYGEGANKIFGTFGSRWWVYTHPWVWSNGGEIVTYPDNEVMLDMEETIQAWSFLASVPNEYEVQPTPDQATEGAPTLFESGRTAMTVDNGSYSQRAVLVAEEQGFTWDLAPIPSNNGNPTYTRCSNNTIACYSGTPHPEEAYMFAAFMSSEKAMANTRAVPSRVATATGPYLQRTEEHTWQVQVDALTDHVKVEPRTPYFEELNRALDETWHSVLDGVTEPEVAITEAIPTLEEILQGES